MRLIDIDNQSLQEAIGRMAFRTRQDVYDLIVTQTTVDAVPVVRCKNCANGMVSDNNKYIICCSRGIGMEFDDFCSYGKRKDKINES